MNITVLAGGLSGERDVSLTSGLMCARSLKLKGHKVFLLDVFMGTDADPEKVFENEQDLEKLSASIETSQQPDLKKIKEMRGKSEDGFFGKNVISICKKSDIVFMALHGANGEDGKIQATFDLLGIRYTGSDYLGSANAMNKGITRRLLIADGIRMAEGTSFTKEDLSNGRIDSWNCFPCVVKPCCGGSSIGVFFADSKEEFNKAVNECFRFEPEIVVEQFIKGREFSVGILDGKALPVIEIISDGFYDYKNKYSGKTLEVCPAELDEENTKKLQVAAEKAFASLKLSIYSRFDFILSENNDVYCLEANTLPGMTQASLIPQEARVIGLSHADLCDHIINKSFERFDA